MFLKDDLKFFSKCPNRLKHHDSICSSPSLWPYAAASDSWVMTLGSSAMRFTNLSGAWMTHSAKGHRNSTSQADFNPDHGSSFVENRIRDSGRVPFCLYVFEWRGAMFGLSGDLCFWISMINGLEVMFFPIDFPAWKEAKLCCFSQGTREETRKAVQPLNFARFILYVVGWIYMIWYIEISQFLDQHWWRHVACTQL